MPDLNLNQFLQDSNSLAETGDIDSNFTFPTEYERGLISTAFIQDASINHAKIGTAAIGTANIGTLTFNEITGGTARLGGTANGDGVLQIFDAGGTKIIQGDNTGHHYYMAGTTEIIRVNNSGFTAYGANGTHVVTLGTAGLKNYDSSGSLKAEMNTSGVTVYTSVGVSLKDTEGGNSYGIFGIAASGTMIMAANNNNNMLLGATQGNVSLVASGTMNCSAADFQINGVTKTAIVPTSKGHKALYTNESPNVWFMDFCESKDKIDPLFLEITSPPYHFIKCEDGEYQVWGIRKGFENIRFEDKTTQQFKNNNKFWSQGEAGEDASQILSSIEKNNSKLTNTPDKSNIVVPLQEVVSQSND